MKTILTAFIALMLLCSACSPAYHVLTTASNNVVADLDEYVFSNSDLTITYDLWSDGGTMAFKIHNKSSKPVFIDWNHSNFIRNGKSVDYWNDEIVTTTSGSSSSVGSSYKGIRTGSSYYSGVSKTTKAKPSTQIPPKAEQNVYTFDLDARDINLPENGSYSAANSPLKFRNYIAYSFDKDLKEIKYVDNEFYVKSVTKLKAKEFNKEYSENAPFKTSKLYVGGSTETDWTALLLGCGGGGCLVGFVGLLLILPSD